MEQKLTDVESHQKIFANNVTPESLHDELVNQSGKFAIISDEGGVFENLSGLYTNNSANIDILLKGIDGGDVRLKRKTSESNINPFLTLWFIVQPQVLKNIINRRTYQGVGFLERILYVFPSSTLGYRKHPDIEINKSIQEQYHEVILHLLEIVFADGNLNPTELTLSDDAKDEWKAFQSIVETKLAPGGELEYCQGWGGKISGFALRIAGLIHVCKTMGRSTVISKASMDNKALTIASILTFHARKAFNTLGANQAYQDAGDVLCCIKQGNLGHSFSRTDLIMVLKNKPFGVKQRLDQAVDLLIERNYLIMEVLTPSNGTKPTTIYWVNPQLWRNA